MSYDTTGSDKLDVLRVAAAVMEQSETPEPTKKRRSIGMTGMLLHVGMLSSAATLHQEKLRYAQGKPMVYDNKVPDSNTPEIGGDYRTAKQKQLPKHHNARWVDPAKEKRKKKAQRQARKKNRK